MADVILKTVVVEDSPTQRTMISNLVNNHPNLTLLGEYENGIVALNAIRKNKVDLIILDVEMPIVSGFDFLESLEEYPQIVLISGKSDYALKAFEYNITDYLQKPIDKKRFNSAISRVINKHRQIVFRKEEGNFVYVNSNLQKKKIYLNHIKWIEALGDYIKLVTNEGNFLVLSTMKAFLNKLPENKFVRIHKSFIVNIDKVDNWSSTTVQISGTQLPMSRSRKDDFEKSLIAT